MSTRLFIHDTHVAGRVVDVLIEDGRIADMSPGQPRPEAATVIDGSRYAVFPTFANLHTHAAMTLFRGYGGEVPLQQWLQQWIWPKEKLLDDERVYWGVRLACVEMIKSGTTAFADMYFELPAAARAVHDSGIRALLGDNVFGDADRFVDASSYSAPEWQDEMVRYCVAPHSVYAVSDEGLRRVARYCAENDLRCHIHMCETEKEVADCLAQHGCRPYEHLAQLGLLDLLSHRLIGAHSLYLSDSEMALMSRHGVTAVHNPNSNLKLGSGYRFQYAELQAAGVRVALGTDGCASSNNLDMLEASKTMSLLQKGWRQDSTSTPAGEVLHVASRNGFEAMGVDAGELEVGRQADMMLVDLDNVAMVPDNDTVANLIYAAHNDAIDTVICNGRVVMRHRQVAGESEVVAAVREIARQMHLYRS